MNAHYALQIRAEAGQFQSNHTSEAETNCSDLLVVHLRLGQYRLKAGAGTGKKLLRAKFLERCPAPRVTVWNCSFSKHVARPHSPRSPVALHVLSRDR